jgi:hypothetical protein
MWNARFTQSGTKVEAKDSGWNAQLPEKSTAYLGFVAEYTGVLSGPEDITLNGFPCVTGP